MVKGTTAYCSVIDVEGLISKGSSSVKLGEDSAENPIRNVEGKISNPMITCHRKHDEPLILCFSILKSEKILKTAISYQPGGTPRVIEDKEIRVPHVIVGKESVSIASYNSEDNEDILAEEYKSYVSNCMYMDTGEFIPGVILRSDLLTTTTTTTSTTSLITTLDVLTTNPTMLKEDGNDTTMPIPSSSSPTELASLETNTTGISDSTEQVLSPIDNLSDATHISNDTEPTIFIEVTSASTINNDTISTPITNDTNTISDLGRGTEATETAATWQPIVTTNETETAITTADDEDYGNIGNATQTMDMWAQGLLQLSSESQEETTVHKKTTTGAGNLTNWTREFVDKCSAAAGLSLGQSMVGFLTTVLTV
ncbi:unnamed protein product [Haemonchus placei]|uniref:Wsv295 n=1 Tax=Haemonchus placei TaxID=6290 RepID=A0A0N4X927_HAEPC|nr:unnamed protein product [Haemonchus placei]